MELNKQSQNAGDNSTQMQVGTITNYNLSVYVAPQNCTQDLSCEEVKDIQPESLFSDEEEERIIKWVQSNNLTGRVEVYECGRNSFVLGGIQYEVRDGIEMAKWEDFMERLIKYGFVVIEKHNSHGELVYKLKMAAYNYVDKLSNEKEQ